MTQRESDQPKKNNPGLDPMVQNFNVILRLHDQDSTRSGRKTHTLIKIINVFVRPLPLCLEQISLLCRQAFVLTSW